MKIIEYNLSKYAIVEQVKKEVIPYDLYDAVIIRLNGLNENNKNVISIRVYGTEVVYKQELDGNEYILPKSIIKEGKITLTVTSLDDNGKVLRSWTLEPLRLISFANKEAVVLEQIPDAIQLKELVTERFNDHDEKIMELMSVVAKQSEAITELNKRLKGCEEIILNPFSN